MEIKQARLRPMVGVSIAAMAAVAVLASPAQAQEGEATDYAGEIVVTAQKRAQALSDVSLSVSAVGSEALANNNTVTIESLQNLVPSISFGNDFNFAKLFIRGIGLSSSLPGVDPSVALHVDGAVVSLAQAQLGSMFDLERVEVLRGPQGTLYGRNATGGTVNLITAKPTSSLDGYIRQTIGGDAFLLQTDAAVGGPIMEGINGRLAIQWIRRDGYGINEFTGNDIDNARQFSARAHIDFKPSETFSFLLTGDRAVNKCDSNLCPQRCQRGTNDIVDTDRLGDQTLDFREDWALCIRLKQHLIALGAAHDEAHLCKPF